jgi:3-oxoacyl-[acyl-carrier-protein] synthase II
MRGSRVAITGVGCICALGPDVRTCADALYLDRKDPGGPIEIEEGYCASSPVFRVASPLPAPRERMKHGISRTNGLALAAVSEAVAEAELVSGQGSLRVGVCMGTTVGSALNSTLFYRRYLDRTEPDLSPVSRFLSNNPALFIAKQFGFPGPCQTICNACSSGTDAIGVGASWIASGICDVAVVGGADELSRVTYEGFVSLMVTDDELCKPFDSARKGLNLGEGAAAFVLESERARQMRRRAARGFVIGYGAACDAHHLTAPSPDGRGLKQALGDALEAGRIRPSDIAFVNAHGTGTQDNDRVESVTLHEMLPGVPFLSTKGLTGHALGAAGAIEGVLTMICLESQRIPASAGYRTPDPGLPAYPAASARKIGGRFALSESLAFGGHNSVIVLEGPDG